MSIATTVMSFVDVAHSSYILMYGYSTYDLFSIPFQVSAFGVQAEFVPLAYDTYSEDDHI